MAGIVDSRLAGAARMKRGSADDAEGEPHAASRLLERWRGMSARAVGVRRSPRSFGLRTLSATICGGVSVVHERRPAQ